MFMKQMDFELYGKKMVAVIKINLDCDCIYNRDNELDVEVNGYSVKAKVIGRGQIYIQVKREHPLYQTLTESFPPYKQNKYDAIEWELYVQEIIDKALQEQIQEDLSKGFLPPDANISSWDEYFEVLDAYQDSLPQSRKGK